MMHLMLSRLILLIVLTAGLNKAGSVTAFEIVHQWNLLDFDFEHNNAALQMFRPENNVPTGIEVTYGRIFVATPRLKPGVGPTLSTISPLSNHNILRPYPDWSWHAAASGNFSCDGLISVYRVRQDSCHRLWVLDSGVRTSITDFTVVCPPKIVIFDLQTDQAIRVIQLPREVLRPNTLTTNLVIDEVTTPGKCDQAFVYITDTTAAGLIVYDGARDMAWRLSHPAMFPDPDFSDMTVGGEKISFMDGIVGIALAPNARLLYFQPQATTRVFSVPVSELQKGPLDMLDELPVALVGHKSSQGFGIAVDTRNDALLFSPVEQTAIALWQPQQNIQSILAYDPIAIQYATDLRFVEFDEYSVWTLTTRFHKFFKETVNPQEINLRILRVKISGPSLQPGSNALIP